MRSGNSQPSWERHCCKRYWSLQIVCLYSATYPCLPCSMTHFKHQYGNTMLCYMCGETQRQIQSITLGKIYIRFRGAKFASCSELQSIIPISPIQNPLTYSVMFLKRGRERSASIERCCVSKEMTGNADSMGETERGCSMSTSPVMGKKRHNRHDRPWVCDCRATKC